MATARTRSLGLAAGLFLLAPLVAEFLLGNLPITALYTLVVLAPLYGAGALLIREVVRRTGRGWPSILTLALAYAVFEEGITTMSLFNPNYAGERLLDSGYIAALGMGGPWTVYVLTLHTVWSISVAIAMMEVLAGERGQTPWLGRIGVVVAGLVFVVGAAASTLISVATYEFVASVPQLVGTVVAVVALIAAALSSPPRASTKSTASAGSAPNAWLVGAAALLVTSVFRQLPHDMAPWLYVGVVLVLWAGSVILVRAWSRLRGWGTPHLLALAAGALLTYAWTSFRQTPMGAARSTEDLVGNAVFATAALVLVGVAALVARNRARAGGPL
jgi:hypothetical protein